MEADADRWAVWWRYRAAHSIGRGDWCAYFGGRSIVPSSQAGPPYWRVNRPGRQVMFSAYHLSAKTANDYLSEIARRRVPWLHGYPSFLALIATYALDSGFRFGDPIRIVTTGAENLLPQQKELIERAFGAPVRQHYGQSEGVANFSECPHGRLHVDEDYSFVEFLPTEMPDQYRVVGTNLTNTAFPFLRYDTQDVVTISGSQCDCGWSGRVVDRVDGRQEDYLVLSDGSRVGRLDHILKDMVEIREAQFRQSAPGKAVLLVVPGPNYSEAAEARLRAELRERLGDRVQVTICHTDRIERTRAGKLRLVVSEMPKERVE
jgi:phenylacetate-CoA ligase